MREEVILNKKEQARLLILNRLERGEIGNRQAAQLLCVSERHLKRLKASYSLGGAGTIAHGNRGRKPINALPEDTCRKIIGLIEQKYVGFNQQHFSEILAEREGIVVSRSTVRRILSNAGLRSPRHEGHLNIASAGTDILKKVCCFRSMAALMIGWKAEALSYA